MLECNVLQISARPDLLIGEQHVDTAAPMAVVDDTVSPLHEFAESSAVVFENDNKKMESQKIEAEDDAEHIDEGELEQEMLRLEKIVQVKDTFCFPMQQLTSPYSRRRQ